MPRLNKMQLRKMHKIVRKSAARTLARAAFDSPLILKTIIIKWRDNRNQVLLNALFFALSVEA
jgi:hypothetical protein